MRQPLLTASCLLALTLTVTAGETPVGWRGDGSGVFPGQKPPTTWNDTTGIAWRVPLPNWSNSSPVVAGGRVYLTSETRLAFPELLCLDAQTGKEVWRRDLDPLDDATLRSGWIELNTVLRELLELRGERLWIHETKPANAATRLADLAKRAASAQATWTDGDPDVNKEYFRVASPRLRYDRATRDRYAQQGLRFASWGIRVAESQGKAWADSFQYHDFMGGNSGPTWEGQALPTPLVMGGTVYVLTSFHALHAFDAATGAVRWVCRLPPSVNSKEEGKRIGWLPQMWYVYSPRWVAGRVVVLCAGFLRAVDPKTGTVAWETPVDKWTDHQRNDPGIMTIGGTEVIALANGKVYRGSDGKLLVEGLETSCKDQGIFLTHQDLILTNWSVRRLVPDGDGLRGEHLHWWGAPERSKDRQGSFRPAGTKSCDYVCFEGKAYPGPGCWDIVSGKAIRNQGGGFAGAPLVLADGRLYCLNWADVTRYDHGAKKTVLELAGGTTRVYAIADGKLLATNPLSPAPADPAKLKQYWRNGEVTRWRHFGAAAPFIAGDRIYIRSYDELICVGAK